MIDGGLVGVGALWRKGRKEGYAVGAVETRRKKGKVYEIHLFFNVPCMYLKIDKFK